jgi:hypothetical protein
MKKVNTLKSKLCVVHCVKIHYILFGHQKKILFVMEIVMLFNSLVTTQFF